MLPTDEQIAIEKAELILVETAKLCQDFVEFRREMEVDHAKINATCGRIDHHLNDITAILRKTNRALR